jgi:hypothetical protein
MAISLEKAARYLDAPGPSLVKPAAESKLRSGSYEVQLREDYKYLISFIDDCSKAVFLYPMKLKSQSFACFKIFCATF